MKEALISLKRAEYMPLGLNTYCIGNKTECAHFEEDGATIIPWGKNPDTGDFTLIESLRLLPNQTQLKKATIPEFIKDLSNLKFLELPLPMALNIKHDSLPKQLKTLMISNNSSNIENLKKQNVDLHFPDLNFPNLKGLWFYNGFGATELPGLLCINENNFLALEYIECFNNKNDTIQRDLKNFNKISFLHISNIGNYDIFSHLSQSLEYLSIIGTKKEFDINQISYLKSIKCLWLNTLKMEVDCKLFTHLPNLQEINILNSKKIINIEYLTHCEQLKSIYFLDCNKPFKTTKQLFNEDDYYRFSIKYS